MKSLKRLSMYIVGSAFHTACLLLQSATAVFTPAFSVDSSKHACKKVSVDYTLIITCPGFR